LHPEVQRFIAVCEYSIMESGDYRLRVRAKIRGEDAVIETEIRKVKAGKNIVKLGGMYHLRFGEVEVGMGESLTVDVVEVLLYMLPEEVVQRMIEDYCERRLKWI